MTIEITHEMLEAVATASLYKEEATMALRKVLAGKKLTNTELMTLYYNVLKHPDYKTVLEDIKNIESQTLVDEDMNTIMLQYNKLLRDAQKEGKFEVAARILKEIREIKAIDNEQMKFEVIIKVKKPNEQGEQK